jgi:catechol 2,3-dioxygenase-like lactoylglutathione lyase family enzyme
MRIRYLLARESAVSGGREIDMTEIGIAPAIASYHHFAATVRDIDASADWYERVFGMGRLSMTFPHHGAEESGYAVMLIEPRSGIAVGLHHHDDNNGEPFREIQTGLDHMAFAVPSHEDLDAWVSWLDSLGIENSGVVDVTAPLPFSVVVFRDLDNIQLELFHMRT